MVKVGLVVRVKRVRTTHYTVWFPTNNEELKLVSRIVDNIRKEGISNHPKRGDKTRPSVSDKTHPLVSDTEGNGFKAEPSKAVSWFTSKDLGSEATELHRAYDQELLRRHRKNEKGGFFPQNKKDYLIASHTFLKHHYKPQPVTNAA